MRSVLAVLSAVGLSFTVPAPPALAQDLWQYIDLNSDAFTKADVSRVDVEAAIAAAGTGGRVDFSGKQLNRLDLSGLDLHGANLQAARLNGTNLTGANPAGAMLDQAWGVDANLTSANLEGASLVSSQFLRAKLDGANLAKARVACDLSQASLVGAHLDGINMTDGKPARDSRRHPFILRSAKLDGASVTNAGLIGAVLEFASLKDTNLSGSVLAGAALSGADFHGANVAKTDFNGADLSSAHIEVLVGRDQAVNFDKARNLDRAYSAP